MRFSTVGEPKAAAKAGQTTGKSSTKRQKQHRKTKQCKQKQKKQPSTTKAQTTSSTSSSKLYKQQQHSSTNNRTSSPNILEGQKRAKIGFSTVGLKAPAAAAAATKRSSNKSNATNNSEQQKRQQKQHEQQEKHYTTSKARIKWQQNMAKQHKKQHKQQKHLEGQKRQVCFSHNNNRQTARRAECGEPNPEQSRQEVWDPEGWEGGEEERGNSVGYQQILFQLVEVKGVPINVKNVIDILEGQTLQRWEKGFDGRRPKAATNKSSRKAEKNSSN